MNLTSDQLLNPLSQKKRIQSIDVLRGIAVFGILLMNIVGFGLPGPSYGDPSIAGGDTGINLYTWVTASLFFEGTMRAIFSMLFGAGFMILTSRHEDKGVGLELADVHYRRVIWLVIFGLVHAYLLLWTGEILFSYGIMGLFLFPFRKLAAKVLFAAGIALICIGTTWDLLEYSSTRKTYEMAIVAKQQKEAGKELSRDHKKALEKWESKVKDKKPTKEVLAEKTEAMHKGYFSIVKTLAPVNYNFQQTFLFRYDVWDILSMMFIGMALFKWKILNASKSYRSYGAMVVVGYAIGITVNVLETKNIIVGDFSIMSFLESGRTYNIGRFFTAMGHVGLIMIFCKSGILQFLSKGLAAVGKTALTNYIMHTVVCNIVFLGFGFSMFGKLERHELYYVVFSIWLFQLIVSPLWLKKFNYGPLEWGWRYLIYKQWPKLRDESFAEK